MNQGTKLGGALDLHGGRFARGGRLALAIGAFFALAAPARAQEKQDADEAEFSKYYEKVDVWHYRVDYAVGYSNQDVIVTRELTAQPPAAGQLCYIRFDLIEGAGDYAYGFKPATIAGPRKASEWGVYVHQIGNIFNQLRSVLKLDVIYFFVDGLKDEHKSAPPDICARHQAAATPEAGHGYAAKEWSDLVVRGKLTHGWPPGTAR